MGSKRDELQIQDSCSHLLSELRLFLAGEIMGSVAHDLNNPLSVLMGRAEIIARSAEKPDPDIEKIKESVDRMLSNCRRMAELIHAVRVVASLDMSRAVPPIPLRNVFERVSMLTKKKLGYSNVELTFESEIPNLVTEQSEPWLLQMFLTLILGANHALENHQSENRWIRISVEDRTSEWALAVYDSGPLDPRGEMFDLLSEQRSQVRDVRFYALAHALATEAGAHLQVDQKTEFVATLTCPKKWAI